MHNIYIIFLFIYYLCLSESPNQFPMDRVHCFHQIASDLNMSENTFPPAHVKNTCLRPFPPAHLLYKSRFTTLNLPQHCYIQSLIHMTNKNTTDLSFSFKLHKMGCLGGSVGWATDFGSGHDLKACEFEPRIVLCADSSEPGACFRFCVSLSLCPHPPTRTLSLSFSKINIKNK